MRYIWRKYYRVFASVFGFFINTFGLVLAIFGAVPSAGQPEKGYITFLLILSECFLIFSVIYTIVSALKNIHNREAVEEKDAELMQCRDSNKTIFENYKASITCYKDFNDRLDILVSRHAEKETQARSLRNVLDGCNPKKILDLDEVEKYLQQVDEDHVSSLRDELIELYNRFVINMIDLLRDSIEEYLSTKGCKSSVSIALKQLDEPERYSKIDDRKDNIYTAFRDSRTYRSKTRNETWGKTFCIRKNSDFVFSIEKDYYIFNYVDKTYIDNGLYLNENSNFYENYNSGVTCTIYSCVEKERILYGFLACDSLFDDKTSRACGKNIYDYNDANMLMATAHVIVLYFSKLLYIWDKYYVQYGYDKDENLALYEENKIKRNLCRVMIDSVKNTRYQG